MTYTAQQIKAEGDKMLASGASAADLWAKAQDFGVSKDELAGAYGISATQADQMIGAAPAAQTAPTISARTPSVWAGAPLSDRQVAEAKDYIGKQLSSDLPGWGGAAFDANGRYNAGNTQRDQKLAGWQQAMGVSDADMARITGYSADEVARAKAGMGAGVVDINDSIFRGDNQRLFPGGRPGGAGAGGAGAAAGAVGAGGAGGAGGINVQGAPTGPVLGNNGAPNTMFVNPWTRTVDPSTMTTQGQLDRILAADGPLMQRASARARMDAQARGMINSSMAEGAAQAAMIDAATPIANADAGVYNAAAADNQKYMNAAAVFNSQAYNEAQMAGFNASQELLKLDITGRQRLDQIGAEGAARERQIVLSGEQERQLQGIKNDTSLRLAQIEAQYKTTMQSSESARSMYAEISRNITNIMMSKDVPAEEKGRLVTQQTELLRSGLAIAGAASNADFLRILDFTGGTGSTAAGQPINIGPAAAPAAAPQQQQQVGGSGWVNPVDFAGGDAAGSGVGTSGIGAVGDGSDGGAVGPGVSA